MNRRDILKTTGAAALTALISDAWAEHAGHDHGGAHATPYAKLIQATSTCTIKGQACINHCLLLLGDGDKTMADCARSVQQMLVICGAVQQLASAGSRHLKPLARVAMDVCKDCEDECRKHDKKHAACKECGDACAACYKECKAIAA